MGEALKLFSNKSAHPTQEIASLIGINTKVEGNLVFRGGLRIDGEVVGDIRGGESESGSQSMVVISEQARVVGSIRADHVVVNGEVLGPIEASSLLELQPKAKIRGDVKYRALEMHQGAIIEGMLMPDSESKPLLKLASSQA